MHCDSMRFIPFIDNRVGSGGTHFRRDFGSDEHFRGMPSRGSRGGAGPEAGEFSKILKSLKKIA